MTTNLAALYSGHRYPAAVIAQAVWLYFRFPLSLRMVEEMLAERGIVVSHETIRRWGLKVGRAYAAEFPRHQSTTGDKWHLDGAVISIAGKTHWLWRAVDQHGVVLDILVQSRRDARAAKRLLRKLMKRQTRTPRMMIPDELRSYSAAARKIMPGVEHRQHRVSTIEQRTVISPPEDGSGSSRPDRRNGSSPPTTRSPISSGHQPPPLPTTAAKQDNRLMKLGRKSQRSPSPDAPKPKALFKPGAAS